MTDSLRLIRLEENLTHMLQHVTEQDKAILALADDVARLRQELARARAQIATPEPGDSAPADERPPHY